MEAIKQADRIREYVRSTYIEPNRRQGQSVVQIQAGKIRKEMGLGNDQVPAVCGALKARKFLQENHLILEKLEGPPKKMASSVLFTFRLQDLASRLTAETEDPLLKFYGIGKDLFESLGGGENFIRKERQEFYAPGKEL